MKDFILALDAGGTFLKAGLFCGETAEPGSLTSVPVNSGGSAEEAHAAYREILPRMRQAALERAGRIAGVCMDTPGPFDYANGISRMTHKYAAINGIPLRPWFREILGDIPVLFLHDSSAFLLGAVESHAPYQRVAGVMIGTGLGFAMMIDNRICTTAEGAPLVSIYKRPYGSGIAEDAVSARGIVNAYCKDVSARPGYLPTAKEIALLAERGDPAAVRCYENMGTALGRVIRSILLENEIEALFLGGQISRSFSLFEAPLRAALSPIPSLHAIAPVRDIDQIHLLGAARYWNTYKAFPMSNSR